MARAAFHCGALLVQLHCQIARINLQQQVPGFHRLVVFDMDPLDLASDLRRDGNDIGVEERIVRPFMGQALGQIAQAEKQQPKEDHSPDDNHRPPLPKRPLAFRRSPLPHPIRWGERRGLRFRLFLSLNCS